MQKGQHKNPLLTNRAFEALLLDGGWLTAEGIALLIDVKPSSVAKSLRMYADRGLIDTRERRLDHKATGVCYEFRISDKGLKEYEC